MSLLNKFQSINEESVLDENPDVLFDKVFELQDLQDNMSKLESTVEYTVEQIPMHVIERAEGSTCIIRMEDVQRVMEYANLDADSIVTAIREEMTNQDSDLEDAKLSFIVPEENIESLLGENANVAQRAKIVSDYVNCLESFVGAGVELVTEFSFGKGAPEDFYKEAASVFAHVSKIATDKYSPDAEELQKSKKKGITHEYKHADGTKVKKTFLGMGFDQFENVESTDREKKESFYYEFAKNLESGRIAIVCYAAKKEDTAFSVKIYYRKK